MKKKKILFVPIYKDAHFKQKLPLTFFWAGVKLP